MHLVSRWALFSGMTRQKGWALLSSNVSHSALSGSLGSLNSGWRCHSTWICTSPFGPLPLRRYCIVPLHEIQSPGWLLL